MHKKRKASGVHAKFPQAHEKVRDENERNKQTKKKGRARKNVIDGRKSFIRCTQRTGENNLNKLRVNDS